MYFQIVREHLNLKKNNENPSLKDQMKALERTRYGRLRAKQKVVDGICSTHSPDKLLKQMSFGFKIKFKRKLMLRVVQPQVHSFLESMSEIIGSDIQRR